MANADGFISNSRAAHWGKRRRDRFPWLGPFIALRCVQSINGFIGERCCELGMWRNEAQVGQITCPRTYKKLGSRSQISWDLYGALLAYFELRCFMFGIPLSLLLCLDPLEAINNPLKSLISCQISRSVGQDALRGRPFIQVVMSADSFFVRLFVSQRYSCFDLRNVINLSRYSDSRLDCWYEGVWIAGTD